MIYFVILTTILLIAHIAITFLLLKELRNEINAENSRLNAISNDIERLHAQVINAEKIIRDVPARVEKLESVLAIMGPQHSEIHNVCVWLAKEIQEAREANKKQP